MVGKIKATRRLRALKFSKAILAGKTQAQAAIAAGCPPKSSESTGSQLASSPDVQAILNASLDKAGATIEKSAQVIARAHDADTVKLFSHRGKVVDTKVLVDHPTRLHAAELNYRVRKVLTTNHSEETSGSVVNLVALVAVIKQAAAERGLPL